MTRALVAWRPALCYLSFFNETAISISRPRNNALLCSSGAVSSRTARENKKENHVKQRLLAIALSAGLVSTTLPAPARANDEFGKGQIKRVLLVSIDGMHAVDFINCAN